MDAMTDKELQPDAHELAASQTVASSEIGEEKVAAWQEIEAGRFMPRRIRGSCIGRALG